MNYRAVWLSEDLTNSKSSWDPSTQPTRQIFCSDIYTHMFLADYHIQLCNITSKKHLCLMCPWPLTMALWPWHWKVCLGQFLACANVSLLKMHNSLPYKVVKHAILDQWTWCSDLYRGKFVFVNSHLVLIPLKVVKHGIFAGPSGRSVLRTEEGPLGKERIN